MAQVRAYLMSFVGLQLTTGRDRFPERFPHPWLVWEPGAWHVPSVGTHQTQLPTRAAQPGKGDALCFELALQLGATLRAGRLETHPLVINDATFSRDQFVLGRPGNDDWTIATISGATPCTLEGTPLGTEPQPLRSGATLRAGDVTLRFYTPFDFVARVDGDIASGKI